MLMYHVAWIPPSDNSWKLNFAGCIRPIGTGAGCILRDQNAIFKVACAVPIKACRDLVMAELIALKHGLIIAINYGVDYIEIEGDQPLVIQMLQGHQATPFYEICRGVLHECFNCIKNFRSVKVHQIHQYSNCAANDIARIATELQELSYWDGNPPSAIVNTLVTDVIGRWIS
ncbi:uncharacterized protein LOC111306518 [Durio zibethinus]|uniref:Uncharacterized protein LOC111306518 n=1 Tax=Durio zibethinus TaxID=66656 RepID=A0A6P6A5T4_DURZI|nr:uncharacterized protein LOC111306518 [Durio zibethinus]